MMIPSYNICVPKMREVQYIPHILYWCQNRRQSLRELSSSLRKRLHILQRDSWHPIEDYGTPLEILLYSLDSGHLIIKLHEKLHCLELNEALLSELISTLTADYAKEIISAVASDDFLLLKLLQSLSGWRNCLREATALDVLLFLSTNKEVGGY